MVNQLHGTEERRRQAFADTPDVAGLLRREGVDTTHLNTDAAIRAAIANLSEEAKTRMKQALGISSQPGSDIDDLCGYEESRHSDR